MCINDARQCIANAEKRLGFEIDPCIALSVYRYALRKLKAIGNGPDYMPVLYESELYDHFLRMALSGGAANV